MVGAHIAGLEVASAVEHGMKVQLAIDQHVSGVDTVAGYVAIGGKPYPAVQVWCPTDAVLVVVEDELCGYFVVVGYPGHRVVVALPLHLAWVNRAILLDAARPDRR